MFVIDNFIKDEVFLKELNDNKFDFFSMFIDNRLDYKGAWWKGWWINEARNLNERLIEYIHYNYDFIFEIYDNPISGIEYWTHIHSSEPSLTNF